jgi:hypothetical protein
MVDNTSVLRTIIKFETMGEERLQKVTKTLIDSNKKYAKVVETTTKTNLDGSKDIVQKINDRSGAEEKASKLALNNARALQGKMMSIGFSALFGGMAIQRFFGNLARGMINTYSLAIGETGEFNLQTNRLAGAWEYLKFSIMESLAASGTLAFIVETVISLTEWFNELSPAVKEGLGKIILGSIIAGTSLMLLGQIALLSLNPSLWIVYGTIVALTAIWLSDIPVWSKVLLSFIVLLGVVGISFGLVAVGLVLGITAVLAVLYVLILAVINWKETVQQLWIIWQMFFNFLEHWYSQISLWLGELIVSVLEWANQFGLITPVLNVIGSAFTALYNKMVPLINGAASLAKTLGIIDSYDKLETKVWTDISQEDVAASLAEAKAKVQNAKLVDQVLYEKEQNRLKSELLDLQLQKEQNAKDFWANNFGETPVVPTTTTSTTAPANNSVVNNINITQQPGQSNQEIVDEFEKKLKEANDRYLIEFGSPRGG